MLSELECREYPRCQSRSKEAYFPSLDYRKVTRKERSTSILYEGEDLVWILVVQIIEKYAANAASLFPMLDKEILVAPFFEIRVISLVMTIAGIF